MCKLFYFIVLCCISCCVLSQEKTDIFSLSLGELTQINITTTQKQTIYSCPSSRYVITHQQIKNMGIQNLQTLLDIS